MSMPACLYVGSLSSTNWMNPIVSEPTSMTKHDSESDGFIASWTDRAGSPHHRATSGSVKIRVSTSSSPACTGRSRTLRPVRTSGLISHVNHVDSPNKCLYHIDMLGEGGKPHPEEVLEGLEGAIRAFQNRDRDDLDDDSRRDFVRRLRRGIDALEGEFSGEARIFQERGSHLAEGAASAVSWL